MCASVLVKPKFALPRTNQLRTTHSVNGFPGLILATIFLTNGLSIYHATGRCCPHCVQQLRNVTVVDCPMRSF